MPAAADPRQPLSAVLREICDQAEPTISVGELADRFGGRAMGALLLVFGLACTLPLPPGGTTIFGAPLVLLAPQMAAGSRSPWLPAPVRRKSVAIADLRRGLPRAVVWLERLEAVSHPRLPFLFGGAGHRLIGAVCTVLAVVLILPIPLGNILPAASVSVLSFSVVQRDGVLAMLGYAMAAASAALLVLSAGIILRLLGPLLDLVSG